MNCESSARRIRCPAGQAPKHDGLDLCGRRRNRVHHLILTSGQAARQRNYHRNNKCELKVFLHATYHPLGLRMLPLQPLPLPIP